MVDFLAAIERVGAPLAILAFLGLGAWVYWLETIRRRRRDEQVMDRRAAEAERRAAEADRMAVERERLMEARRHGEEHRQLALRMTEVVEGVHQVLADLLREFRAAHPPAHDAKPHQQRGETTALLPIAAAKRTFRTPSKLVQLTPEQAAETRKQSP